MKIYNQTKTEILDSPNLELGYLKDDEIVTHHEAVIVHHDAVIGVEEKGHYETIAEYPNGGKDVKWVVDIKGVKARDAYDETVHDAYDETEPIQVYIPYTDSELARNRASKAIADNKALLEESDYAIIKFMDSYIKANPTLLEEFASQYPQLLEAREGARAAINASEQVISGSEEA